MTREARTNEINNEVISGLLPKTLKAIWKKYQYIHSDLEVLALFSKFMDEVETHVDFEELKERLDVEGVLEYE